MVVWWVALTVVCSAEYWVGSKVVRKAESTAAYWVESWVDWTAALRAGMRVAWMVDSTVG